MIGEINFQRISMIFTFQALCMFVQEMHYMTQNIAKAAEEENYSLLEELSEDLKIYELRAVTLLKELDLSQIEDDLNFSDDGGDIESTSPLASLDEF